MVDKPRIGVLPSREIASVYLTVTNKRIEGLNLVDAKIKKYKVTFCVQYLQSFV